MTGHEQEECSGLQQETSDGQWLSDDMTERTARVQMTTGDGDDLAGLIPERVDSDTLACKDRLAEPHLGFRKDFCRFRCLR